MRRQLLVMVCVCAAVGALGASSSSSLAWRRFKSEHAKVYGPEEEAMRFANFLESKQLVERHNANPNATFQMRLNHMADWTHEERQQLTGIKLSGTHRREGGDSFNPKVAKLLDGPVPKEVDWRKVPNRVSAVGNQGNCSSAWAFAATGLLEGQQVPLGMSKLIPLSEQYVVDCTYSNSKCRGGSTWLALLDIAYDLGGIEGQADYPYEAIGRKCKMDKSKFVMKIPKCSHLKPDEETLLKAVANYGPVATSILATINFQHYGSGVFDDPRCVPDKSFVDHDVLLVGYGTDPKGGDYWLVKNSWGTDWGEEGYIRIKRGVNMCAIADNPIVAKI